MGEIKGQYAGKRRREERRGERSTGSGGKMWGFEAPGVRHSWRDGGRERRRKERRGLGACAWAHTQQSISLEKERKREY